MARTLLLLLFAFLLLLPSDASTEGKLLHLITLDDDIINPVSAEYIIDAVERAEAQGAVALIVELDTPGGLLTSTRTIVKRIMNAKVPVVVYVAPRGARAGSAGVFITLAAHVAAMAPSTNIGAAHPVQMQERRSSSDAFEELAKRLITKGAKKEKDGKEEKPKEEKKPPAQPMEQKILNDTKAWVEAIARERGRNPAWAVKAVEESVSVPESEALKLGIIDLEADSRAKLIEKINGLTVEIDGNLVSIDTKDARLIETPKNFRLRWLMALAHPNIAYILMMLGFYGLLFEFTHPGTTFPGIIGATCLILAFFGLQVLPTNYAGVALIVLAIGMFIAEIKVTSYGLLTIGGVIALFFGSLILFSSPYDFMRVSIPVVLSFTLATMAIASFLAIMVVRSSRRHAVTGAEGLIGEAGEVKSWESGRGKIFVHGEIWDAKSVEEIKAGESVEVESVEGMTLVVKRI
ncbi:MAG TPA: nodulation protein NfeD [bacterium]|nr:nodulation protein NfeD [bacterium]